MLTNYSITTKTSIALLLIWNFLFVIPNICLSQESIDEDTLLSLRKNSKISHFQEIESTFRNGNKRTSVIVGLTEPDYSIDIGVGADNKSINRKLIKKEIFKDKAKKRLLQQNVKMIRNRVLSNIGLNATSITNQFKYVSGFAANVTLNELHRLASNQDVLSISKIKIVEAQLDQGISLMNGDLVRDTYTGSGISIAICDTGIDYNHPDLGGGDFPNEKVIGGIDIGGDSNDRDDVDPDDDPMDSDGHGTACAGIAAGDLADHWDYTGGVAPDARLYAVKISYGDEGHATGPDMIDAWEWILDHQDDDPDNPIMIISTSFGSGRYTGTCDNVEPLMTQAAENAVAAGITIFAAAGNDGYCDSIGWPACIEDVISVGAVYDDSIGRNSTCISTNSCIGVSNPAGCSAARGLDEWSCTDTVTTADQVTCYSNSSDFLDILAPSNDASTTDIVGTEGYESAIDYVLDFGGTSAACPYAAGAAAVLQSANMQQHGEFLTPDEIRARLSTTGVAITDAKSGIETPRVNLAAAIDFTPPQLSDVTIGGTPVTHGSVILRDKTTDNEIYALGDDDQSLVRLEILINGTIKVGEGPFTPSEITNVNWPWPTESLSNDNYFIEIKAYDWIGNESVYNFTITLIDKPVDPVLVVSPLSLVFSGRQYSTNPDPQYLSITNGGSNDLSWTASTNASWLNVSPASGGSPFYYSPAVTIDIQNLPVGTHSGDISVVSSGNQGSPTTVPVTLKILDPVVIDPESAVADTYLASDCDYNCEYGDNDTIIVGSEPASSPGFYYLRHGLIKFIPDSISGSEIGDAKLRLYVEEIVGDPKRIYTYEIVESWAESSVDWGDDLSYYNTPARSVYIDDTGWVEWDVTDMIRDWAGGLPNNGFFLRSPVVDGGYIEFASREHSDQSKRPILEVEVCDGIPNLSVSQPRQVDDQVNPPFFVGQAVEWEAKIINQGDGCSVQDRVRFYLGTSSMDFSREIESEGISYLLGGSSVDSDVEYTFLNADIGTKYLNVKIDGNNSSHSYGPFSVIQRPEIHIEPTYINFTGTEGESNLPCAGIEITNYGGGTLDWAVEPGGSNITIHPESGTAPSSRQVCANISGLTAGEYDASITISSPDAINSPKSVPINLFVLDKPGYLLVTPDKLIETVFEGEFGGPFSNTAGSATYTLSNVGGFPLEWSGISMSDWITVSPSGGIIQPNESMDVQISINSSANFLEVATYTVSVYFENITNDEGTTSRDVKLNISPVEGTLSVLPQSQVSFIGYEGGPFNPESRSYSLTNIGGSSFDWSAVVNQTWLSLSSSGGNLAAGESVSLNIQINNDANGLAIDTYNGQLSITNTTNGNGNTTRNVSLAVMDLPSFDVNADGTVDIFDLVLVSSSFGRQVGDGNTPPWATIGDSSTADRADTNDDGTVDIFDLVQVSSNFAQN